MTVIVLICPIVPDKLSSFQSWRREWWGAFGGRVVNSKAETDRLTNLVDRSFAAVVDWSAHDWSASLP